MFDKDLVPRTRRLGQSAVLHSSGSFSYVVFIGPVSMRAIVRTREELFTTAVEREAPSFDVVVNGNYFNATRGGKFDALVGHDPVAPSETLIEGQVVRAGAPMIGDSRPQRFYLAEIAEPGVVGRPGRLRYMTAMGNPPSGSNVVSALGNLGPLISNGLPYGQGNRYRAGTSGPAVGEPGPARPNLTQRNNQTFASVEALSPATGKTVIAYHAREQALLVGVQPHGVGAGQTYTALRNGLIVAGFSDAVFLDGSDSSLMWYRGRGIVRPGENKDELMTVGLGFRRRPATGGAQ